jgi:hypothetical protein
MNTIWGLWRSLAAQLRTEAEASGRKDEQDLKGIQRASRESRVARAESVTDCGARAEDFHRTFSWGKIAFTCYKENK